MRLVSVAAVLALLAGCCCPSSEEMAKSREAREAREAEARGSRAKWQIREEASPMDDSTNVYASAESPTKFDDWTGWTKEWSRSSSVTLA